MIIIVWVCCYIFNFGFLIGSAKDYEKSVSPESYIFTFFVSFLGPIMSCILIMSGEVIHGWKLK